MVGKEEAYSAVLASETLRVAKTAAKVQSPENAYFENVSMPIDPPPPSAAFERWEGGVPPTFIVCWDHPKTGRRAYQFIRSAILLASTYEVRNHPGCDNFKNPDFIQNLIVSFPLLEWDAEYMRGPLPDRVVPDPRNWTPWIDEVLPRPPAPEAED